MSYGAEERDRFRTELLAHVPEDGSTIGNGALIRLLGWSGDQYWSVRDELIEDGRIQKGKGRGGTVRRIIEAPAETSVDAGVVTAAAESVLLYQREAALYEPMRYVIAKDWARDRRDEPIVVEITASQGGRPTGGRWSRPDIVSVSGRTFLHLPGGKFIEVTAFEVKPSDAIDVSAVYESLAHRRSATHSYVLLHVPDSDLAALQDAVSEICEVARFHGIGVIVAGDPSDYATWDEREVALRVEPDPARLDAFISTQLAGSHKIAAAVR